MTKISSGLRSVLLLALAAILLVLDVESAHAQAAQCARLQSALVQFDNNSDYRRFGNDPNASRQLQRAVQDAESLYIRRGCNDDARAGRTLTQECQGIARNVLKAREDFANVNQGLQNAAAVAQQREAILQEMARFGCSAGVNAGFSNDRQNIFDRIFGSTSEQDFTNGDFIEDDYWGVGGTVRTLCVRLSDGYFWPISYSTLPDYVSNDAITCQQMCPNTPVDLFFYNNPGEEPEQMRNTGGVAYSAMPYAFAYRNKFDTESSCKAQPVAAGSVKIASSGDGQSREIIEINGASFPMPLRDPRGIKPVEAAQPQMQPVEAVALVSVPLPRPRPAGPGEIARRPEAPAPQELRIVHFDGKAVRVVGPDTPYAQAGRAGT